MTKYEVLKLLRGREGPVSGQSIAETLHISRAAVWKAVESLRQEGYGISSHSRLGYRLEHGADRLSAQEIKMNLGPHPWVEAVTVLPTVDSTNDAAKQLAAAGAPEGTAVIAEHQTKGRGRLGRRFESPEGQGIYLSVILRPRAKPTELLHLTAAAAQAIAEAVQAQTGVEVGIKWVNDLVVDGKKLAGILTELSVELESGMVNYLVVGVGINCCQGEEDFPPELAPMATSLAMCTGVCPDRNALAAAILCALSHMCDTLLSERSAWMAGYTARCVTIGKPVRVLLPDGPREGFAVGIDENAALEVEYPDGSRAQISSGEVSVRGLYGYV